MFNFFSRFASRRALDPRECALLSLRRGDLEAAEQQFSELLGNDGVSASERAFLLNKRGAARARLGLSEAAKSDFHASLEASARYAPALVNLGNLALEDARAADALEYYAAAVAADEAYAPAYYNMSVACKRLGRIADSVQALRKAQKLEGRVGRVQSRQS